MAEWLRQGSAKPFTAVQFRPTPRVVVLLAGMEELVYSFGLKPNALRHVGSSPAPGTM